MQGPDVERVGYGLMVIAVVCVLLGAGLFAGCQWLGEHVSIDVGWR